MSDPDQLRRYARDCLRLSQDTPNPQLKIHLIDMAEAWGALAAQSERIAQLCASAEAVAREPYDAPREDQRPGSDAGERGKRPSGHER